MGAGSLEARLAELTAIATNGEVTAAEVAPGTSLRALGVSSLGFLRLIDAIEAEYGVELDLDGSSSTMDTVAAFAEQIRRDGAA